MAPIPRSRQLAYLPEEPVVGIHEEDWISPPIAAIEGRESGHCRPVGSSVSGMEQPAACVYPSLMSVQEEGEVRSLQPPRSDHVPVDSSVGRHVDQLNSVHDDDVLGVDPPDCDSG